MAEVDLPDVDTNEHRFKKYDFENANHFYDVLLNFNDTIDKYQQNYNPAQQGQRRWIFRGQWDSTKGLTPTAFRPEAYEKILLKELKEKLIFTEECYRLRPCALANQIALECDMLRQFMEAANNLGIECNYAPSLHEYIKRLQPSLSLNNSIDDKILAEWPDSHILPIMALARHHGIPTRLLDFSYNPFFAAFFAASPPFFKEYINENDAINKTGNLCIWAINEKEDASVSLKKISTLSNRSSNLFAQEGLLIMDTEANKNFLDTGEWYNFKELIHPDKLINLTLPQSEYKKLLRLLWKHDVTPVRIMPNLDKSTETLKYTQWIGYK